MKAFLATLFLATLAGCSDFQQGFTQSYNRVHSADTAYYAVPEPTLQDSAPIQQPVLYSPPPANISGSTWTPGSNHPFTYYNINPQTGAGSLWTPGASHPFTYFNP